MKQILGFRFGWMRGAFLVLALVRLASHELHAASAGWEFTPRRLGRALVEEGWMADRTLAVVDAAADFKFPLQLIYLSTRTARGDFGDHWFCPQLSSTLIPKGKGVLAWTMPSGGVIGLFSENGSSINFRAHGGEWFAKIATGITTISSASDADRWQYLYKEGRLTKIISPSGRSLDYSYKADRLFGVALHDNTGQLLRPLIALARDKDERLNDLTVPGRKFAFTFSKDRDGARLTGITDSECKKPDAVEYDAIGVLKAIKPAAGESVTFTVMHVPPRDQRGNRPKSDKASEKLPANYWLVDDGTFKYSYAKPKNGLSAEYVTIQDKAGSKSALEVNPQRGSETVRSNGQERTTYFYRAPGQKYDGKLRRIEENGIPIIDNRYDKTTGLLTQSRDRNGVFTYYEYALGATGALASRAQSDAAAQAQPAKITRVVAGKKEVVAQMKYDAAGRLVEQANAAGQATKFAYNTRGELDSVIDPTGQKTSLKRDAFGRPTEIAAGEMKQAAAYDEMGRTKSETKPDGQRVEYTYGARGRLTKVTQNGVPVTTYEYDEQGGVAAQGDALGRRTTYEHGAHGNSLAEHQPNGAVTRYEYDKLDHRTAQIDGKGNRITFRYDTAGRLLQQENPLHQILDWKYDERGRLLRRGNGVQNVVNTYDKKGNLIEVAYSDAGREKSAGNNQKLTYAYDEAGRLRFARTASAKISYFYDDLGRIAAKQFKRPESERVLRYTWNARGQKTSVTLSEKDASAPGTAPAEAGAAPEPPAAKASARDGKAPAYHLLQQTEYVYDATGRLVEISGNGRSVCKYTYDPKTARLIARQYGNGIQARYAYDTFGRQTRLDLTRGPLLEPLLLAYEWDLAGQLTSRTWNGETQFYTYDPAGQLLTVSTSDADGLQQVANSQGGSAKSKLLESYAYDLAGNITEKFEHGTRTTMTYDPANQLKTSTIDGAPTDFTYDPAGRLTAQHSIEPPTSAPAHSSSLNTQLAQQQRQYGLLDKVLLLTKPDGTRIGFDYAPDGQLTAKYALSNSAPATPVASKSKVESPKLLEELVWDDLALIHHASGSDAKSFAVEPHASGGAPIAVSRDPQETPAYLINDILGTTLAVITPEGVQITPLTAFGKPLSAKPANFTPSPAKPISPEPKIPTKTQKPTPANNADKSK